IYSLGVIVFELLIGQSRFDVVTPLGLAFRDESAPVPQVLDTNPNLPAGVQKVMDKVLARDRSLRYESSVEFAQALNAALAEHLTPVPTVSPTKPVSQKPRLFSRSWMLGGFFIATLAAFAFWGYPKFAPPVSNASPTGTTTATTIPSTTASPVSTTTPVPTKPATPVAVIDQETGGANKIALLANDE